MQSSLVLVSCLSVVFMAAPALAAQGQITEVNPSGVHGTVVVLQADDGEEVAPGDSVTFVRPFSMQDPNEILEEGLLVLFTASCNRGGHCIVEAGSLCVEDPTEPGFCEPSSCPCVGCCD